jgi:prepilin-type N-terminal cleavage/methylation domain-containing protein
MPAQSHSQALGNRSGITLIETIVVLAIIALLLAFLLPAVQRARSAAQDTACKNNLHQLVVALEHYRAATKKFPAPVKPDTVGGWAIDILPFLEEQVLADQLAGDPAISSPAILPHIAHRPHIMTCPFGWEGDSSVPGIPASHYAGEGISVSDLPMTSRVPWPESPRRKLSRFPRDEGPHSGGYFVAYYKEDSVGGDVQWFEGN